LNINIIESKVIPSISKDPIVQIDELMKFIIEYKPDVIHSHLFEAEIVSRWQLISGVKYITHCHDNMVQFNPFSLLTLFSKKRITLFYERQLMIKNYIKSKTSFISISEHTFHYFQKSLPLRFKNQINLLFNAINYKRFSQISNSKNNTALLKIVNIGSFVPKKNQQFLLKVVHVLKERKIPVVLTLLGNGNGINKIKSIINEMHLENQILMPGNVDNVEDYLSQNDIYVHSAYYEPFGLVLLEAMAAGLPVVCLNGGGNKDIMQNGKNGFILEEQNVEAFADKVVDLYSNKILYSNISTFAKQYAQQYDIKPYVDSLLEIYKHAPACIL
jgi:glycosyltransferase involved in cell wall biosynthesis